MNYEPRLDESEADSLGHLLENAAVRSSPASSLPSNDIELPCPFQLPRLGECRAKVNEELFQCLRNTCCL